MRILGLLPLALLVAGCWTPGPGQIDPTHYPWDQPKREPKAEYCVIALEPAASSGITIGNQSPIQLGCAPSIKPNTRR